MTIISKATILLLASASQCLAETISLAVSKSPPPSASTPIAGNFQSFSIEFAFFPDFGGNLSSPNRLTNVLLSNLREFSKEDQIIRIGGLTQDKTTYDQNLEQAIFNYWPPGDTADQPVNSTIGPAYWQSLNAIQGVSYIFGLNFYKNDSTYLTNLHNEVSQTLQQVPLDRIHLFELGNENDYSAAGGFRPPTYNQLDYVEEWINKTRHIQVPNATAENSS